MPNGAAALTVEILPLKRQPFRIKLDSYGVVKPRTASALMSQVSGQVLFVDEAFRDGGFFTKGDLLVAIDDSDYLAEVNIAKANLITAQQNLTEELARVEQAALDWKRLGNEQQASDLVLRIPQQESANANLISAQAQLKIAQLALSRTKIIAPYSGRVISQDVDLGTVVSSNTVLAEIYATDYLEVRLAINNSDLAFVELPETNIDNSSTAKAINVTFTSDLIGKQSWTGKVVRTESEINSVSRQLYVVAQINNPFEQNLERGFSIKIGEYVSAQIEGKTIEDALSVPVTAIYQGSYVYIEQDGVLLRKDVKIAWQNDQYALIKSGLEAGQLLVITPLGQVSSGTAVRVAGNESAKPARVPEKRPLAADKGPGPANSTKQEK
ncbi:MAG: efflux transporter periplasmic adaptor subunit [Rheinheimera sp.]|nr:efflux transporter periplasmic adaptor subunit [Rheinheimera sp.]